MKTLPAATALLASALAFAGCAQMSMETGAEPGRILSGTVGLRSEAALPAGAIVVVRVLERSGANGVPVTLGEQRIEVPTAAASVPFSVEYRADDGLLVRGVVVDARASVGGRLLYFNGNGLSVRSDRSAVPQEILLVPVD